MVGSTHEILDSIFKYVCTVLLIRLLKIKINVFFFPLIEFKNEIKMTWKYVLILYRVDSGII